VDQVWLFLVIHTYHRYCMQAVSYHLVVCGRNDCIVYMPSLFSLLIHAEKHDLTLSRSFTHHRYVLNPS
jgi:hypothetical protein